MIKYQDSVFTNEIKFYAKSEIDNFRIFYDNSDAQYRFDNLIVYKDSTLLREYDSTEIYKKFSFYNTKQIKQGNEIWLSRIEQQGNPYISFQGPIQSVFDEWKSKIISSILILISIPLLIRLNTTIILKSYSNNWH